MSNEFLEKVQKNFRRHTGSDWSPEVGLENFALYGRQKRVEALTMLDDAVREASTSSLREYSRLTRVQTDFEDLHERMIREGR
jgi:hypothetical protein